MAHSDIKRLLSRLTRVRTDQHRVVSCYLKVEPRDRAPILRVLWSRREPMTVREVHAELSRSKATAYTTVLKMLTIMADKGLVRRDESERSHTYLPRLAEPVVQSNLLKDLMRRAFSGSALTLVQRAIDDDVATPEELDQMARLIAQAKARRKG